MKKILKFFKSMGMMLLGLVGFFVLLIVNFGLIKKFVKGLFVGTDFVSLNEKEQRKRLTFQQLITTPSLETHKQLRTDVADLIAADQWLDLSNMIVDLDQNRRKCEAGYALSNAAMTAAIQCLAQAAYGGHNCHPGTIYDISDAAADMLETKAAVHSDSYPLLALAALARCYQGWCGRGADYAEYVTDDGWFGMNTRFAKASWLLDRFDPVAMNSPVLAAVRHKLLGFMPDADKFVQQYYEDWSDLDPFDQTPHQEHALMMLPRWFGDDSMLAVEAEKAVQRTKHQTGDAAYFSFYSVPFERWDPHVLNINFDAFAQGAHDLITLRNSDPAFVAQLYQQMLWWGESDDYRKCPKQMRDVAQSIQTRMNETRKDILRSRLTAVHGHSWDGSVRGAIEEISMIVQDEIKAGDATFALTQNGLVITPGANQAHDLG
jgi:hypothetical protein